MATVPALVFESDAHASSEAVHFANFPGVWYVGQPIAVSELGFDTGDEAQAAVAAAGLPLSSTTVAEGDGLMPQVPGTMPGADEARATGWTPQPGDPGAELAPGEVFPPDPPRPAEEDLLESTILDMNAGDAVAAIEEISDTAELDALTARETAGKNRTTVLKALADRKTAVEQAATDETDADEAGS